MYNKQLKGFTFFSFKVIKMNFKWKTLIFSISMEWSWRRGAYFR